MRNCTKYINEHLPEQVSNDPQIIQWMQSYLASSWADKFNGYLHYNGVVHKVYAVYGVINVLNQDNKIFAVVSIKGFKKYVRRFTQYQSQW